jgi:ATP-dependent Clp protease adapter protein ClpS
MSDSTKVMDKPVDIDSDTGNPWNVILYNDDYHTMDEVVRQIIIATGCAFSKAYIIMIEAHLKGRAIAYSGTKSKCHQVAQVLRKIRLQVEIDEIKG